MQDDRTPNLLIHEKSPYLLQHAYNPVHWRPWNDESFRIAKEEDKAIFISIGYATCHWCHVMEHESFENDEIASYLNEHFVCIKVDREERPDVDSIYMDVCQAMTGRGGWPLTVFMDSDLQPFFAGTYFPPKTQGNRIGFLDLLNRVNHAWTSDRKRIVESAQSIIANLQEAATTSYRGDVPENVFEIIANHHKNSFDEGFGGFGDQPKFPSPHHLLVLFRIARRTKDTELVRLATQTLDAMSAGGIYDHVGFGFHRYSTDREWLLPHFEKMLYDQAMLMMAYTEAWQITGRVAYKQTVLEIADFLRRDMTSPQGAFYSALDADSEGEEGKFYVWSFKELQQLLNKDDVAFVQKNFGVKKDGNFHDEATGEQAGVNILHRGSALATVSPLSIEEQSQWNLIRTTLLAERVKRIHPITDDKVLTDWNGLMITALAKAARACDSDVLETMAVNAFQAVTSSSGGEQWVHRYRDGDRNVGALLADRAAMGWAAIELYQGTADTYYLVEAKEHAAAIVADYRLEDGALATASQKVLDIPVRQKEGYDSAYPSGNSMAAMMFASLGAITTDQSYYDSARDCVHSYGTQLEKYAPGFCMLLSAWDMLLHGATEIVFVGDAKGTFLSYAREHIGSAFLPEAVIVHGREEYNSSAPSPSVLICRDSACLPPFITMDDVNDYLADEVVR